MVDPAIQKIVDAVVKRTNAEVEIQDNQPVFVVDGFALCCVWRAPIRPEDILGEVDHIVSILEKHRRFS